MQPLGLPETLMVLMLGLLIVYPVWRIASRMGYPGVLGLLVLIPLGNILLVWFLAFADWPVLRELRTLRGQR